MIETIITIMGGIIIIAMLFVIQVMSLALLTVLWGYVNPIIKRHTLQEIQELLEQDIKKDCAN